MVGKEKVNMMHNPFIESLSPTDFDSTVARFSKEIEGKAWKLLNVYDLQETMGKFDKNVLPAKVFSLCHPNHASRILEKDYERIVSPIMPCRVSIYEKHDGKTYVSRMNLLIIASSYGGIIEEVMTESGNEIEEIIEKTVFVK